MTSMLGAAIPVQALRRDHKDQYGANVHNPA